MDEDRRARSHGWMWTQNSPAEVDRTEWNEWHGRPPENGKKGPWFKGENYKGYPTKEQLRAAGSESMLEGWVPSEPIIRPESKVVAFGSCFAAHFVEWLATHGYNQVLTDSCRALMRNPFESIIVVAQQLRWAFGEMNPAHALWIDKNQQRVQATEERRLALRQALLDADVFLTTLGISEVWYDKATGESLWRVMPFTEHDPDRHGFRVLSIEETIGAFETIDRIRAEWLPNLKIIYTLSPMPLAGTFRPVSVVTANVASKAIIRAALDQFLRSKEELLNRTYFYYPGYEIVTATLASPYTADHRHLYDYAIDLVLDIFSRHYTTHVPQPRAAGAADAPSSEADDLRRSIAELETDNRRLQSACDARLSVIDDLKRTCDERLALIGELQRACDERLAVIEGLTQPGGAV